MSQRRRRQILHLCYSPLPVSAKLKIKSQTVQRVAATTCPFVPQSTPNNTRESPDHHSRRRHASGPSRYQDDLASLDRVSCLSAAIISSHSSQIMLGPIQAAMDGVSTVLTLGAVSTLSTKWRPWSPIVWRLRNSVQA